MTSGSAGSRGVVAWVAVASIGIVAGHAGGGVCIGDCGAGDIAETEGCVSVAGDRTNDGCNQTPNLFQEIVPPVTICGTSSTDVDGGASRDTDWFRITQATMLAADADGNGVITITGAITSELPMAIFVVQTGVACGDVAVVGKIGSSGPGCAGGPGAEYTAVIADHPDGIVAWCGPGNADGSGIFTGFPCSGGANDYLYTVELVDQFTACDNDPSTGSCSLGNGTPGCDDPHCCVLVCNDDAFCCDVEWDENCASQAISLNCAPAPGGPVDLANGCDPSADNYLRVSPDAWGAWASVTFGGGGDEYNPVGAEGGAEAAFSAALFYLDSTNAARQILTNNIQHLGVADDASIDTVATMLSVTSDENGDGCDDRAVSQFAIAGSGVDITVDLDQAVYSLPGGTGAVLDQEYALTNNGGVALDFEMTFIADLDLLWGAGVFDDDSVGTDDLLCVFAQEVGQPETRVTMCSETSDAYTGSKRGIDPDGGGPDPPFDFGTDTEEFDNFGLPASWANHIAGVGTGVIGESGAAPAGCVAPCDAKIILRVPVVMGPGPGSGFVLRLIHNYGDLGTPGGCTGDCGGDNDDNVGIVDLLALLAQWGGAGSCDLDDGTVGITDLLVLLANWGPC